MGGRGLAGWRLGRQPGPLGGLVCGAQVGQTVRRGVGPEGPLDTSRLDTPLPNRQSRPTPFILAFQAPLTPTMCPLQMSHFHQ